MRKLALLLLLLLLPLTAVAQTAEEERDRSFLSDLIEGALTTDGQVVRIDGFRGALSSSASVARLSIADEFGEWLIARDLVLDWNRSALFGGRLEVERLSAGSIELIRAPEGDAPPPSPEAVPFALPALPVSVDVGLLSADRIVLGAGLIGQEVVLSLNGTAQLAGGEGTAEFTAERIDGPIGRFAFTGGFSNVTRVLSVDLDLTEGPGGIAATLLNLPGDPSLALTVDGTAPIDSYESTLRLASDGEERVTGRFLLGTTTDDNGQTERAFTLELNGDVTPLMAPDYRDFFGPDVRLSLTGRTEADGSFDLSALDINAQAVRLQGNLRMGPTGWPETLSLTGDLGLPDGTPVVLPLSGDPVTVTAMDLTVGFDHSAGDSWTGRFVMRDLVGSGYTVPALTLDGGGTITPASADAPGAFSIDLDYAATGLQLDDPALARAIGTDITGEIRALRQNDGPVTLDSLTVNGPGLTLAASGTMGGPTDSFPYDATLDLAADDLSRFDLLTSLDLSGQTDLRIGLTGQLLNRSFAIDLAGTTTDLALGIAQADAVIGGAGDIALSVVRDDTGFRVERVAITTTALTGTGSVVLTSGDSEGSFSIVLDDVARVLPGLAGPAEVTGTFANGAETGLSVDAAARLPGAVADFTATRPAGGTVTTLDLTAAIPALAAFAEATGMPLTGTADLTLDGTLGPDGTDLVLAARTAGLGIGVPQADLLLAGDGAIDATIRQAPDGTLAIDGLQIRTDLLDSSGTITLANGQLDAEVALAITETRGLAPGLSGPARLSGTVGRLATGEVTLDLAATAMGADAAVAGMLDTASLFRGRADVSATDLSTLAPLTGLRLSGAADISVEGELVTTLAGMDLTVSGTTTNLDPGIAALTPLLAGEGLLDGRILRQGSGPYVIRGLSYATPDLRAQISGQTDGTAVEADIALTLPRMQVIAPGLDGTGSLQGAITRTSEGNLSLDLTGAAPGTSLSLTAASDGSDPLDGITGTLSVNASDLAPFSRVAGRPLGGAIDLNASGRVIPRDLSLDVTLDATARNLDPGNATLARLLAGTGTVSASVGRDEGGTLLARNLDIRFPNFTITGTAEGEGNTASASFDARLADLALFAPDFSGPATATGTARLDSGAWTVDAALTGPGGTQADVNGTIGAGGAMNIAANGSVPLGLVNGFLEPRRIEGQASFDLRLNGAPSLNNLSGTVRTAGAAIVDPALGIGLRDITGTVTLSGGRASVDLGAGVDPGGRLVVSGSLGLTTPLQSDLTITASELLLRDPQLYETTANGIIRLTGPLTGGALIAGTIDLGPTEVQIPSSGVGGLGDLPQVVHIGTPGAVAQTLARAGLLANGQEAQSGGGGGAAFRLDILISAPSRVFIRGRGLDAELGGTLRIGGTTAQIVPVGGFELIRGRLDILQQRFTLTEGRADLQGDFIPYLRLVAETEARTGTTVSIIIEGPATEPEVTFSSSPELPQDEVLAQLLFGRDINSMTPLQAVQLAAAVGTLAGRGGGGIIGNIRNELGVDDLDVVTTEGGGAALRVGAYLSENVYTDVTLGDESSVSINLDLTRDVTVTGRVDSEGDTSLGIFFERDY